MNAVELFKLLKYSPLAGAGFASSASSSAKLFLGGMSTSSCHRGAHAVYGRLTHESVTLGDDA
jgi:hypothetical protein